MDFRQLQYILAVAEHKNVTKAAAALYISQPSLSHFIARAEEELGVQLFDRSVTPLQLTYAGELYVARAQEILRVQARLKGELRDISGHLKGRLRIGVPHERAAYMLPLILPRFRKLYPGIQVEFEVTNMWKMVEELSRGRVDFGLLPCFDDFGFERMEIYSEPLLLAAAPAMLNQHHMLEGHTNTVDPSRLGDLPFILSRKGHALYRKVNEFFAQNDLSPEVVFQSTSNITSLRLAAAGLGVTIVPEMTTRITHCPEPPKLCSIGFPALQWSVALHYRKDSYVGAVERAFFETARQVFAQS